MVVAVPALSEAAQFLDISESAGVDDDHHSNSFGVGQAWIDVNRDSYLDLFVTDRGGPNHLYINQGDETFAEFPAYANLALSEQPCHGVGIGDYDNDGWQDIYIACAGPNRLFRNLAGAAFEEVGAAAGVANPDNSQVITWGDVNNDGYIDIYLVNYFSIGTSRELSSSRDALYLNQGDGTFIDMGHELDATETQKPGLAATFLDFDGDMDLDIYVINDRLSGNTLWRNDGAPDGECTKTWCFTDVSAETNTDRAVYGMGIAVGDYDHDGDEDLYFSSIGEQVLLQSQITQGELSYIEKSNESGLNFISTGWATLFFDVDNDTWLDAYIATWGASTEDSDQFYINQRDNSFLSVSETAGIQTFTRSEGAAKGDFNNDGLIDVIVTDPGTAFFLYKNVSNAGNNWISFELTGGGNINRDALGAVVEVTTTDLSTYRQMLISGGSRGSGNELRLHFGLGDQSLSQVKVIWPNGTEHFINPGINDIHQIRFQDLDQISRNGFE